MTPFHAHPHGAENRRFSERTIRIANRALVAIKIIGACALILLLAIGAWSFATELFRELWSRTEVIRVAAILIAFLMAKQLIWIVPLVTVVRLVFGPRRKQ
jgi:hypothetical protein